jgi:glycosyltransferase involved in cell wall biosynthesis
MDGEHDPVTILTRQQPAIRAGDQFAKPAVTAVIWTRNEAENLPGALASVRWADAVMVVDSHSTDGTAQLALAAGAELAQFDYPGHGPKKRQWALNNLTFPTEWLLFMDADERVGPELRTEISEAVRSGAADGYCLDREFWFMGRSLRCFRPNWTLRLFRHRLARMEDLGLNDLPGTGDIEVHEHVVLDGGRVGFLRSPLWHDDDRGLGAWLERHNRYATWEAHLYRRFRREPVGVGPLAFLRLDPVRRKRVLRRVWVRLPCRPLLRFVVWYGLRRGFLDGPQGFFFCALMAWYELTITAKLYELEQEGRPRA